MFARTVRAGFFGSMVLVVYGCGSAASGSDTSESNATAANACRAFAFRAPAPQESLAVGDFDGDGKQDIAVSSSRSATISVLFQGGAGFDRSEQLATGNEPCHALATVAGEGASTLAAGVDNRVDVLGGMSPANSASLAQSGQFAGDIVTSIAIGDVDGDGRPDVVSGLGGLPGISVLLRREDGALQEKKTFAAPTDGVGITLADLDGNGSLDAILANPTTARVTVMLNDGHGAFGRGENYKTGEKPVGLAVGDVNGDHLTDVISVNTSGTVSVLLGDGAGKLSNKTDVAAGEHPVAVAFVTGAGGARLVVANQGQKASYGTLVSNGDGTFQAYAAGPQNLGPSASMLLRDVNGDDLPDLLLGAAGSSDQATGSVLLGTASGAYTAPGDGCR